MSTIATDRPLMLYKGWVKHIRQRPQEHQFQYTMFQILLDVDRPELIDRISPLWSSGKFNAVRFNRNKYLAGDKSLNDQVTELISQRLGTSFEGRVYLLASLSYWGICYNPVNFFFCYNNANELCYILSEIHNTPWGEHYTYIHDVANESYAKGSGDGKAGFRFHKQFHVSPFMPMDIDYDWRFDISDEQIFITMNLQREGETLFNVSMKLRGSELTDRQANLIPFKYPLMCVKVFTAIYWQAFKLWCKKIPFFDHPRLSVQSSDKDRHSNG